MNMKKEKIGIPRALTYYEDNIFWQSFLRKLNYKVIIGPQIDEHIISLGEKYTKETNCIAYKSYIGEILYLEEICDYILITSIVNTDNNYECCPLIKNIYNKISSIISSNKILNNYIDYKNYKYKFIETIKIGLKLNKNLIKIIYSYIYAIKKQKKYDITRELENKNKLNKEGIRILIISQSYNLENSYFTNRILSILKENNIIYLLSNFLDKKLARSFSEYFADNFKLKYESEAIGAIYYYQYQIDGIILLSENNCPINNLLNNILILRKSKIPYINLNINENNKHKIINFLNILKKEYHE